RGRPFFVMEYIEGLSLEEVMQSGEMATEDIIDIAIQICQGLKEAHAAGLIHRDIKPGNIAVDRTGRVRILDFGLVRAEGDPRLTRSDSALGTLKYLSPEQITGREVTTVSDLFSLGIVLYQMVSGQLPFEGEYEAAVMYSIVNDTPKPVNLLRADVPPRLADIIARLVEKDVSRRYQTAADVIGDLRKVGEEYVPAGRKRFPRGRYLYIGGLMVTVIVVLALSWPRLFEQRQTVVPEKQMLAVLPFENLGPPEHEYFSDGMTDAITTHLAKFGDLGVISRTSSMLYKNSRKTLRAIGDELGATYVLTGSIYWEKTPDTSRVKINAQLVRVADDSYLWADSYERVLGGIFALQSEIAQNVTRALNIAIREDDRLALAAVPTKSLEAYDYYLRGSDYFNRSWDKDDIEMAIRMFERAVAADTTFALAYAMLSRGHESMYWEYFDRADWRRREAWQMANKALGLDPELVEGHLALGYCYYHCSLDYENALKEFSLALASRPSNADLYSAIAAVERRQADLSAAVVNFIKASHLDPRSHLKTFDVGLTYGLMRRFADAEVYIDRTIDLAPTWSLPYLYKAWLHIFDKGDLGAARRVLAEAPPEADMKASRYYWWLVRIIEPDFQKVLGEITLDLDSVSYYLEGARMNRLLGYTAAEAAYSDSARQILEVRVKQRPDDARFNSELGLAWAGLRQKEQAVFHAMKGAELLPTSRDAFDALFLIVNLAEVFVIFGEYEAAVEQLEFLLSIPGFVSVPYLKLDPLWIPLREHPRFQQLLGRAA
ncbi:MAG: protein kinase, partial [candidate division Zixibacteria bacterium]|nr:protein kinase [candidate division Zixibacteria bacterium]